LTTSLVFVTFKPTLNVQTSKQRGKKLAVHRGPLAAVAPSHGTTGTIVNLVLLTPRVFHKPGGLRLVLLTIDLFLTYQTDFTDYLTT